MLQVEELNTTEKRSRIEAELHNDPNRSDREIGRIVGVDHKTVGAARERLGNSPTPPSASATEVRQMLIKGTKAFDSKFADPFDVRTAEEVVDDAVRDSKVTLQPGTGGDELECWIIPRQHCIECRSLAGGGVEIWQEGQHGDDEDRIHISDRNAVALARRILWAAGFKSIGIYAYAKGGGCVDLDDGDTPDCVCTDKPGYGPVR